MKLTPAQRRKLENDELVERWKKNECIPVVSSEAIWFPPRPIIKKDLKEIKRLYGSEKELEKEPK